MSKKFEIKKEKGQSFLEFDEMPLEQAVKYMQAGDYVKVEPDRRWRIERKVFLHKPDINLTTIICTMIEDNE